MDGSWCLDTTIAIPFLNGEPGVLDRIEKARSIYLAPVVIGELLYGAASSTRASENTGKVEAFARDCLTLEWTWEVGRAYSEIKSTLRRKGTPIPENDIWIAAFAVAHGLPLAARDAHFARVEGLRVEAW